MNLLQELRYALRSVLARPAFAGLVVLVLSLGLGCVLFALSLINGAIWPPLPFRQPENLVAAGKLRASTDREIDPVAGADLLDWRERLAPLADVAGYQGVTVNLSDAQRPERVEGAVITANLWDLLGVQPALGRAFAPADDEPGAARTVILSDALWKSRYDADPAIVGKQIRANAQTATVVGVMPPRFDFPFKNVLWLPAQIRRDAARDEMVSFDVVARLHQGASAGAVQAALDGWLADKVAQQPDAWRGVRLDVMPLELRLIRSNTRALMNLMLGAVLFVLLIACANAANLLLAKTLARSQELAVRLALGAGRARLVVHLLSQSAVLTALACALGLLFAHYADVWLLGVLDRGGDALPYWASLDLDARMLLLAVAASAVTALLTGLLPAWRVSRSALNPVLRDGGRTGSAGGFGRISRWLVTGEVALSCVLLIGTGVLLRGVHLLGRTDFGFHTDHLLTARIALFEQAYPTADSQLQLYERLTAAVRGQADVADATVASALPAFLSEDRSVLPEGMTVGAAGYPGVHYGATDDRFAAVYGATLSSGRWFDAGDRADGSRVAVVDTTFAERFWPGESALGKRFTLDPEAKDATPLTIVGVIAPLHLRSAADARAPDVLVSLRQFPQRYVSLAVRTLGDPDAFAPRLAAIMREVDADTPLYWLRSMDEVIRLGNSGTLVVTQIFSAFGVLALVLAGAGLYGIVAFNVGQRTREIGVRRALGAPDRRVLRSLLARNGLEVGLGLAIGLGCGIPCARLLAAEMQGASSLEPGIFVVALATLAAAALLAAWLPARRALRIDPTEALRHE
jgi:predicted permease